MAGMNRHAAIDLHDRLHKVQTRRNTFSTGICSPSGVSAV